MAIFDPGNTHVRGGVFGTRRSQDGLLKDVSAEVNARRQRYYHFSDFDHDEEVTRFTETDITAGTVALINAGNAGIMRLSNTTANQGIGSLQFTDANALLIAAAGRVITFGAGVNINDVSDADWFIGLGETDTTFMSLAGALLTPGSDNMAGFHHLVADVNTVDMVQNGAGGTIQNTDAISLPVDDTFIEYGVRITGLQDVEFFMDGIKQGETVITTAAMDTGMVPTFAFISNGNAVTMDVDYAWWSTTR